MVLIGGILAVAALFAPTRALHPLRQSTLRYALPQAVTTTAEADGKEPLREVATVLAVPTAARLHDYFNIVATSAVATLTIAAHAVAPSYNLPLAILMCAYLVLDSIWLALRPEIAGGTAGGGALTLLAHHAAALFIAAHAAMWAPHTGYTSYMAVVEINTLILMLERTVARGALVTAVLHKLFVGSWVITRLVWFPILAVHLIGLGNYPSMIVQLVCACCLVALTVLQLVWTWNFCVPPERQIALM